MLKRTAHRMNVLCAVVVQGRNTFCAASKTRHKIKGRLKIMLWTLISFEGFTILVAVSKLKVTIKAPRKATSLQDAVCRDSLSQARCC